MRKILTFLTALFLPFPAQAADDVPPAKPALWKVSDADTTIYLFGTIHLLKPGTRWLDGDLKRAYEGSSELVVEMVEPGAEESNKLVMARAVDPDGPALTQKLTPEDAQRYKAALGTMGLPAEQLDMLEPWFLATLLSVYPAQKLGYDPQNGVDKMLIGLARASGKTVTPLETLDEQLSFLDGLAEADQIKMLNETVRTLPELEKSIAEMIQSWSAGDAENLAKLMDKDVNAIPSLKTVLITNRNKRWADWVQKRLDTPGTVFMAVGAGHLAGDDSVQKMLAARHLSVTRVR